MKVLVVSESIWVEGVVYDLHILSESLSSRGHNVSALDTGTPTDQPDPSGAVVRLGMASSPVELMSPRLPALKPVRRPFRLIAKLASYIAISHIRRAWLEFAFDRVQPDVVLLYSGVRLGPDCVKIARRKGIPVVFRNVDRLHNLFGSRLRRMVARRREKRTYPHVDRFLALTPNYRDYLVELGAHPRLISIAPFPLNVDTFAPQRPPLFANETPSLSSSRFGRILKPWIEENQEPSWDDLNIPPSFRDLPILVFVGTFYDFGGLLELVEAVHEQRRRSRPFRVLLVGDGPLRPQLEGSIARLGLSDIIHITGYEPFERMPEYISVAAVCINVFPINSQTKDIFSAKIVQYLACGKPVVTSRLPGIERALDPAESGVIYADDVKEVLNKALEVAQDIEMCAALSAQGRAYVERTHSVGAVTDMVEKTLEATASGRGKPLERK